MPTPTPTPAPLIGIEVFDDITIFVPINWEKRPSLESTPGCDTATYFDPNSTASVYYLKCLGFGEWFGAEEWALGWLGARQEEIPSLEVISTGPTYLGPYYPESGFAYQNVYTAEETEGLRKVYQEVHASLGVNIYIAMASALEEEWPQYEELLTTLAHAMSPYNWERP